MRVSGQRLVGCGAAGFPPRSLPPPSLPGAGARSFVTPYRGGGVGRGGQPPPPTFSRPPSGPSPAPLLVWGLGLWRRRVAPAVAPVGEGAAQGPDHWPEDPLMVLWGCPGPRGYLSVSSVPPEEHGIKGPVPQPPGGPLVGPAQPPVHLPHQGEGLLTQRVRDRAPVPVPGPGPPSVPRAGSPRCPCACGADAAPRPPPPPRPSGPAPLSARGGLAGAGVVGVGGGRARRLMVRHMVIVQSLW